MNFIRLASFASFASLVSLAACSGTDPESNFGPKTNGEVVAGPEGDIGGDTTSPAVDAGADGAPRPLTCSPAPKPNFTATWRPPTAFAQDKCSSAQITAYYDECLTQGRARLECEQFVTANLACVRCLESKDTDATHAAVIWHYNQRYYSVNFTGCIARQLGDLSADACGAKYDASYECKRTSCESCWDIEKPSFEVFQKCQNESEAGDCRAASQGWRTVCPSIKSDPRTAKCFPAPTAPQTAREAFFVVAPQFCGK